MDVATWLRNLGLERYEPTFRDNEIDAEVLPRLTAEDLTALGVTVVGHRRRLLDAIAALRHDGDMPDSRPAGASPPMPERGDRVAPATPEPERRHLTVLLCDLVGSTVLSARLDPEDLREVISAYHRRCAEVITRYEGHVAKFLGDGVLAYFGYPRAHEDDAERAVRAGLGLVESVGDLRPSGDLRLEVRVGIATGLVVVGDLIGEGAGREEAVVGETPNLAARLQALAQPGTVLIAASTRRLVGDLFNLTGLGPQHLKGFAEPVRAWAVLGSGAAEGRFEALRGSGGLTPLVGREHEIGLLADRWEQASEGEGEGQVVLLSGEAGVGKSRLLLALRERLADERYTPLSHFCSPYLYSEPGTEELRRQLVERGLRLPKETVLSFYDPDPDVDVSALLGRVAVPALVTHGTADQLIPFSAAEYLAEGLPDARLYGFEGKGHLPIFTATDEFCDVLRTFVHTGTIGFENAPSSRG